MSVFKVAGDEVFWDSWADRFTSNANEYITPEDEAVKNAVEDAELCDDCDENDKVDSIWEYVNEKVNHKLSKKWKTPSETLDSQIGDCEDVSFLAASMLLNVGIGGFEFVIGDMTGTGNDLTKHTWLEVNGRIVDPTTPVGANEHLEYRKEMGFKIMEDK